MSRPAKEQVTFRIDELTRQRAQEDAVRRGCTLEQWAQEVFEHFAAHGYRGPVSAAETAQTTCVG